MVYAAIGAICFTLVSPYLALEGEWKVKNLGGLGLEKGHRLSFLSPWYVPVTSWAFPISHSHCLLLEGLAGLLEVTVHQPQ